MKLLISREALKAIRQVVSFIESKNTKGSGKRWLDKLESHLLLNIEQKQSISLCKYPPFRKMKLYCIIYKDWIVALKYKEDCCVILAFVYGSNLNY